MLDEVRALTIIRELTVLEMIRPQLFDAIVKGTLSLSRCVDTFILKTPTVGINIGYEVGR